MLVNVTLITIILFVTASVSSLLNGTKVTLDICNKSLC